MFVEKGGWKRLEQWLCGLHVRRSWFHESSSRESASCPRINESHTKMKKKRGASLSREQNLRDVVNGSGGKRWKMLGPGKRQ